MSTTKNSPEKCALGCTDSADIIPRSPASASGDVGSAAITEGCCS